MSEFDLPSFLIGLLLGMIIAIILVWISYFTRSGAFIYCPAEVRACVADDYYNNPGEAIANGSDPNQILYIQDGKMYYKRVPKNGTCAPDASQTVRIAYPQYCLFSGPTATGVTGKDAFFNANIYATTSTTPYGTVRTDQNCVPRATTSGLTDGVPILQWDPSYLPQTANRV